MDEEAKSTRSITRILVPLDGSRVAEGALPYAEALARATGARISLLTVMPPLPVESVLQRFKPVRGFQRGLDRDRRAYLKRAAAGMSDRGLETTSMLWHGNPAQTIVRIAERVAGTLVVMATHGAGGLERWMVGSVADRVMRTCARSVLLVCPTDLAETPPPVTFKCLLVPLDGSALAESALSLTGELARGAGAGVRLVRAEPHVVDVEGYDSLVHGATDEADRILGEWAHTYLEQAKRVLPPDVRVETAVLRNSPRVLPDYADYEQVDLVVMASHGRGGLQRATLGSVTDRMVRHGVPTLIVRAAANPPLAPAAQQQSVAAVSP
jgi:nucleotide-binding universal stress UspA family protein